MSNAHHSEIDDSLLKVLNLKTEFQLTDEVVKAVDGISFELKRGEALGIVGESGSGKSVTSLSIMRLLPKPYGIISGGSIRFKHGDEWLALSEMKMKKLRQIRGASIAMIFQEPMSSLNPVLTCGHQVTEAVRLHQNLNKKDADEITLNLFRKVKLPEPERIFSAYPHQISGGQKQRVMIAMAISCNPDILIADEPTTALDVTVQQTILDLMRELQQEYKMSLIFITHDLGVISNVADRVLVMYQGKIVEQGDVESIFKHPEHPYTKGLMACRPPLHYRYSRLPVITDFMEMDASGKLIGKANSIKEVVNSVLLPEDAWRKRYENIKSAPVLLEVKNLRVSFSSKKSWFGKDKQILNAVDDVSFSVREGETLGLVGESGCGKTTLARALLQLIQIQQGSILYRNQELQLMSSPELKAFRRKVQIIFQDPYSSLNPRMMIGDAITEPMKVHKLWGNKYQRKEKAIDLLESVGLTADQFQRYPHEFSGGQRQRICIARALALNPEFIICDESVSALDVSVQATVLNLLMDLRERFHLSYIFISHDLSVVRFMSDRIMVMNQGKIEEIGLADDIYNHPSTVYTKRLIDSIPVCEFDLEKI